MREVPEQGILLKPLKLELMTTLALDYNQLREIPDFLGAYSSIGIHSNRREDDRLKTFNLIFLVSNNFFWHSSISNLSKAS
jgi:hypothetical protein